ncbi:hypothetical protein ANO11243_048570 [Dothideomycetidae sp. 11243]|nr:hypothetical protein ANO11243_048570 [fungal sp. No.11243]
MVNGTPLHPGLTHWPFAFLTVSFFLDALQPIHDSLPASVLSILPPAVELHRISFYALSAGLLTAVPAVLSGGAQAVQIFQTTGVWEKGGGLKPKVKAVLFHAITMDIILAAAAWVWSGRDRNEVAFTKEWGRAGIAVALSLALMFSMNLGGQLTYNWGMGMTMGKKKTG